jgi:amino acid transporter
MAEIVQPGTDDDSGVEQRYRLRKNAISLAGAIALPAAFMGPATSVYFSTYPAASTAGIAIGFTSLLATLVCLMVASSIAEFSRKLPSAGFSYTFATRTFGPRTGFIAGWLLLAGYLPLVSTLLDGMSFLLSGFLSDNLGIHVEWYILAVVIAALVFLVFSRGVRSSAQVALFFLAVEIAVMTIFGLSILFKGGGDGVSLTPFNPAHSLQGVSGIGFGLLWGILMFVGFESAGTLGEETVNPRRNVPRALYIVIAVVGLFYTFATYAAAIGFGVNHVTAFANDQAPWSTLAHKYWGRFSWVIILTAANSIFAVSLSGFNAISRVLFSMGRERVLPAALGTTHPKTQVPLVAGAAYMVGSLAAALALGIAWGPITWYNTGGSLIGLGIVITYILVNLSVMVYYRQNFPQEFSIWRHAVVPILASLLLLLPIYGLLWPIPPFPINLVPYIFVVWIVIGVIYLMHTSKNRPAILASMGRIFETEPEEV